MVRRANGHQGVVRYGSVPAATLKGWKVVAHDDAPLAWTLTATAVDVNRFYITQTPLTLSLRVGSRQLRWSDVVLEIVGGKVSGTLIGRPEER
jgi:hypothetical protein